MMKTNIGLNWMAHFEEFDEQPFAAASIGQVHKAVLKSKERVVVKVQYPGVRESIHSDIENLSGIMKIPGLFPKGLFIENVIRSTKEELLQECDYESERVFH